MAYGAESHLARPQSIWRSCIVKRIPKCDMPQLCRVLEITQGDTMHRVQRSLVLTTIFIAFAASSLHAQMRFGDVPATTDLTPSQRTFAQAYLTAVTGPDIERYKRLLHPATRACMTKENGDFFDSILERRVGQVAVSPRLSVEKLAAKFDMFDVMAARGLAYPVRPTHAFHIEISTKGTNLSEIAAFGVLENGAWYEVLPCPTAKAISDIRVGMALNKEEEAKARQRVATMKDPLRAELLALLKEGKSLDAALRYKEVMHVDLTMAMRVVDALGKAKR